MPVDKFGRSLTTGQNVTNVSGISHEYVNSNFLRKGQAIDMSGQSIVNIGSPQGPMVAVRKKYVNEKFFKRGNPIDMENDPIKTYCLQLKKATKGYVDSKSVGESDLDINGNSVRHTNPTPIHEDEVVLKQWIENNFLSRNSPASAMARNLNIDGHNISYLRAPEQNHHTATKGYADAKLSLLGGSMQGGIGMAGNRISYLGEPEQSNDAVRLSYGNEFYLKRDGTNWMRGSLHAGGFQVIRVGDPRKE